MILGAAVGAGTSTLINRAWDSGEKWLATRFANHQERAREKAVDNALKFLRELGDRVAELERTNRVSEQSLSAALESPDLSVTLQEAMLSAAQTEDRDKHHLLSRLIEERIKASPESLVSMTSKMACDVVSYITPSQLQTLDLAVNIMHISPTEELTKSQAMQWLQHRISPLIGVGPKGLDYMHLESLSCMRVSSLISRDLSKLLRIKLGDDFDFDEFQSTQLGQDLKRIWEKEELQKCTLTTVGRLLGVMVSDQRLGDETDLKAWG